MRRGRVFAGAGIASAALVCYGVGAALSDASADPLFLGVLGSDGHLVPIAMYDGTVWSAAWPEPTYERAPPRPSRDMPSQWYLYSPEQTGIPVRAADLILTDAHCGNNWAFLTDWSRQEERMPSVVRIIAGVVVSRPLPVRSEDAVPGVAEFRDRFNLLPIQQDGVRPFEPRPLGYFRFNEKVLAVFLVRGYEAERYEVYELSNGQGAMVVKVDGGGC